jgi:hypothetical protein
MGGPVTSKCTFACDEAPSSTTLLHHILQRTSLLTKGYQPRLAASRCFIIGSSPERLGPRTRAFLAVGVSLGTALKQLTQGQTRGIGCTAANDEACAGFVDHFA